MQSRLIVRCPNCGSFAKRHVWKHHQSDRTSSPQVIRTDCPHCDYLMTICMDNGTIHSVYSPITNLFSSGEVNTSPQR